MADVSKSRWRRRASRRLALALVFCVAFPGAAARADDGVAVLEIVLDGRVAGAGRFVLRDGRPLASRADWRGWGLRMLPGDDGELLAVDALPGVRTRYDAASQTLHVEQPPDLDRTTTLAVPAAPLPPLQYGRGAVLDYDLLAQRSGGRAVHGAAVRLRAFSPLGVFEHAAVLSDAPPAFGGPRHLRLATAYTRSDPERLQRLRVGDFVSATPGWARPLRLMGVQATTDFALRPDLVTAPQPQLGGVAAVPSTVDLLVNGVRQLSAPVEPGRFDVRGAPVVSGLGEVAVVVRDALGRESVQRLAFYSAQRQLAAGMTAYALQAGRVRRGFGSTGDDHGPLAASGSWRAGLNDAVTIEAHGEGGAGVGSAGIGTLATWPGIAALNADLSASRSGGAPGAQLGLGFERQTRDSGVAAQWSIADRGFRDVAGTQGEAMPRRSLRATAGASFGRLGTLGVAWIARDADAASRAPARGVPPPAQRLRLANASWSVGVGRAQLHANAFRDFGRGAQRGFALALSLPLAGGGSAGAGVVHDTGGSVLLAQAGRGAVEPGDVGWRVQADQRLDGAPVERRFGEIEWLGEHARVGAAVDLADGQAATRFGAQGSLAALGGALHATRSAGDSVALVELDGMAGVAVYHEHRYVGRTDASGRLLVPQLLSLQSNRLHIDPLDLPLDVDAPQDATEVRPAERHGIVVRLPVVRKRAALLELRDARGEVVPLGAAIERGDGKAAATVGHDGLVYLADVEAAGGSVQVTLQGSPLCRVRLDPAKAGAGQLRKVACL